MTAPSGVSTSDGPRNDGGQGVARRHLLRGGAVLAGAAGTTVLGAAIGPPSAHAEAGKSLILGTLNESGPSGTAIQAGGDNGTTSATLQVINRNGPALRLEGAVSDDRGLGFGELAMDRWGPQVGTGLGTTYLATGDDLDFLALPVAFTPRRLLDTRIKYAGGNVVSQSRSGAINQQGQLTAGSWIDVGVLPADWSLTYDAVFVNITATRITGAGMGFLTAYPAGSDRPDTSTLNFKAGETVANAAFIKTGLRGSRAAGTLAVRIYVNQDAAVLMDLSGATSRRSYFPDNPDWTDGGNPRFRIGRQRNLSRTGLVRKPLGRRLGR